MAIKIGLDAGHGLKTAGKQTPDGIKEWTLNDKVRDKVVKILADYDCEVIHTDYDEGAKDESIYDRRKMYINADVDVFVSIHHNAYKSVWGNHTGVEVYTDKNPLVKDTQLAKCISSRLAKYTGLKDRGVKQCDFVVINQDKIPAVLVEGGFMDSNIDYKVITSDAGQDAYAKAVAEGLIEFCGLKKKAKPKPTTTTNPTNFLPKRGYFRYLDSGENVRKINEFYYKVFPSYEETLKRKAKNVRGKFFGLNSVAWTKEFQRRTGLEPDGCIGKLTLAKLEEYGFKY